MGIFSQDEEPSWSDIIHYEEQVKELKAENARLKEENEILLGQLVINDGEDVTVQISESQFDKYNKYRQTLQEMKGVVTALYMNNWLQMNETARKSIQLLQDLITKAEEE